MIKKLIQLEWKQFSRSSHYKVEIVMKILVGFTLLYFAICFVALGIGTFFMLKDVLPNEDPLNVVCRYLIVWFFIDLIIRLFLQKLSVFNIQPLMLLPIKKESVILYLIGKTILSFFNILPMFFFIPFSITLFFNGYGYNSFLWFLAMVGFTFINNFLTFFIQKKSSIFYTIASIFTVIIILLWWDIFNLFLYTEPLFYMMYQYGYAFIFPFLVAFGLYQLIFVYLRNNFYLDEVEVKKKTKEIEVIDLKFLDRFGKLSTFLKNDIRMIWRNKRPKKVLLSSFIFLFYGIIFFPQQMYSDNKFMIVFASIFVTAGFLFTFGQMVPSWDSQYYKLLMSQNISYRKYLESKWYLMVFATIISFILVTPYLYFGWNIYSVIAACTMFNIGLNSFFTLLGGALNKTRVELNINRNAFGNMQGFSISQILIAIPKMFLPILLYYPPYLIWGHNAAILTVFISGVIGLLMKNYFMELITKIYKKEKYKTIAAFSEKK